MRRATPSPRWSPPYLLPGAMEIMDETAIRAAEAAVDAGYPQGAQGGPHRRAGGPRREEVAAEIPLLDAIIAKAALPPCRSPRAPPSACASGLTAKAHSPPLTGLSPDFIVQDGVVPRRRLGEALRRIEAIGDAHGIKVANVFHAGDGNLHPLILYDGRIDGALERGEACAADIIKMCTEMGGSITGEHGVGMEKRAFLPGMFSQGDLGFMKDLRRAFDPQEIANRGKMFPDGEAPSLQLYGLHPLEEAGVISRE
ncbi:MAG: FAD-linked oxidase C-terminal domain-containing protein [Verrucomicrobiales bacterium]